MWMAMAYLLERRLFTIITPSHELFREIARAEALAGDLLEGGVPVGGGAALEKLVDQVAAGRGRLDQPTEAIGDRATQLRGHQLAEHVVLVIDWIERQVNLRGPIRRVATLRPRHLLVALHQVP